jgi:hypothetical protein
MLMKATDVEAPNWFGRVVKAPGSVLVRRFYLRAYRLQREIDPERLRYYVALAALRRLTRWGMWRRESPQITGCKPAAMTLLADGGQVAIEECFRRCSGKAPRLRIE